MDAKAEELAAIIDGIRDRVRSQHPEGTAPGGIPLADLTPLLRARDSAEAKVAAIGTVNPRPSGFLNNMAQAVKRQVARALDWHVREQVEFNRSTMNCVQATIEAINECNRAVAAISGRIDALIGASETTLSGIRERAAEDARHLSDIRHHWIQWRQDWERKLSSNEVHFLRSLSELQANFHHRVTLLDEAYRNHLKAQHGDYQRALEDTTVEIQKRLWADMERIRLEYETVIQAELRLLRQKASLERTVQAAVVQPAPASLASIDWLKFAERFRGSEEYIKQNQRLYAERFAGSSSVLDIGCGRGELLEVLKEAGIPARGIDLSEESIAICRSRGLDVEVADLFVYLSGLPDSSIGGIMCSQVVEHLPVERLPEFIRLAQAKITRGGLLAIETPNPECLAIFATHFFLDPTHVRPIPLALLAFYLEEAGFGRIEVVRLHPALETLPSVAELPEAFRDQFFGAMDYAIFGRKL